jgi:hypothetical protein
MNKRLSLLMALVLAAVTLAAVVGPLAMDNPRQAQAASLAADAPKPKYVVFNSAGFTATSKASGTFLHEEYNVEEIVYSLEDAGSDQYITLTLQAAPDGQGPWLTQATYTYTSGQTPVGNTYVLTYPRLRYTRWLMAHSGAGEAITPVIRSVFKYLPYEPTQ